MNRFVLLLGGIMLLSSCKEKDKLDQFSVVYDVEFIATWSASTHPTDFPSNAHFSPIVAVSHLASEALFIPGLNASEAVQELAETGKTDKMNKAIEKWLNTSIAIDQAEGSSFDSPGMSGKLQIGVREGYQTVTTMTMIAPSPDWFISATTSLLDPSDGLWYDEVISHAIAYDAGTDSGVSFTSPDEASIPVQGLSYLNSGPLTEGSDTVVNIGYFRFTRIQ
ncbi:MAG: spondin domain-containing protein [Bacteroidetes bacterium]|nr:spondin domain-containing protein [Bacteroidota bacterium]